MFSQVELELFGDVLLAGMLGFVVGLERELMGSPAGDRTFSLVAIRIDLSAGPRPRWNSSENRAQPVLR
jgi:hypothetical protein